MEMIGGSEESGKYNEVFDFESIKSWITRRELELLLPHLEEAARSPEFQIWFKTKVAASTLLGVNSYSRQLGRNSQQIASLQEIVARIVLQDPIDKSGLQIVQWQLQQQLEIQRRMMEGSISEGLEAADMDFPLAPHAHLIHYLQNQMKKLVEPSYFSEEGKAIVGLWSESKEIQRSIMKLSELGRLIPDLNKKMSLTPCSKSSSSGYSSAAADDEKEFTAYRHTWELFNGKNFEVLTSLSPMLFTHCAPGCMPWYAVVKPTLQILSIKVTCLNDLPWPLKVYGIIAARDTVDNCRNPLFLCPRNDVQLLTEEDPFLRLTGPSRAVVCEEPVMLEIQLKLKGRMRSEDKVLMSTKLSYNGGSADRFSTLNIGNRFCKMEFCCQKLESSVQSTIVGVRVDQWQSSFRGDAQVFCSSLPRGFEDGKNPQACPDLLLHDWKDGISMDGHLNLQRHVVSAELGGKIKILIKESGGTTGHVLFTPKKCNFSQGICSVGATKVEVTVSWSMHVEDNECILSSSYVDPFEVCPPLHPSVLTFLRTGTVADEAVADEAVADE